MTAPVLFEPILAANGKPLNDPCPVSEKCPCTCSCDKPGRVVQCVLHGSSPEADALLELLLIDATYIQQGDEWTWSDPRALGSTWTLGECRGLMRVPR